MNEKKSVVVNVNVDWRVLLVLGLVVAMMAGTYLVSVAQDDGAPDTNSQQAEPVANPEQVDEATLPPKPDGDYVATTNFEWVPAAEVAAAPLSSGEAGESTASGDKRHFYLTDANYATDVAKTACASGYHMASFWEILDVSNLIYDYGHPAAHTKTDSGVGPPSYWNGWVRTGYNSSGSGTTGTGNCQNWTSASSGDSGVSVRLSRTWETAPGDIGTWDATSFSCSIPGPVWCMAD